MKLLNRLRELRNDLYSENMVDMIHTKENQHHETIGIGATTIDDIARLNIAHISLKNLAVDSPHSEY